MNKIGTQTIETERLILRRITLEDVDSMFTNWTSDPLVTKYVTWETHSSINDTKEYVESKIKRYDDDFCFDWIVVLKESNKPIGEIEAVNFSKVDSLVEMGDCYGSKYWNKGYATEALKAFIDYMFNKVGVNKIYARHIINNPASGKVMLKAGMKYDGTLKGYAIDKNTSQRTDVLYFSIDK